MGILGANEIMPSIKSEATYAKNLVKAALAPANAIGEKSAEYELVPSLARVGSASWAPVAIGVAVGMVTVALLRKEKSGSAALLGGLVGGLIGFSGSIGWGSRQWTGAAAREAAQNVRQVRDSRWLEKNPIAYA